MRLDLMVKPFAGQSGRVEIGFDILMLRPFICEGLDRFEQSEVIERRGAKLPSQKADFRIKAFSNFLKAVNTRPKLLFARPQFVQ